MATMMCTCTGTAAMPPICRTMAWPDSSSAITDTQTQGKKRPNTPRHNDRRSGGSRVAMAAGRRHWWAKNMPPTQTTLARTWISVSVLCNMGVSERLRQTPSLPVWRVAAGATRWRCFSR